MLTIRFFLYYSLIFTAATLSIAAEKMPREHVIDVPAIGESLCVHNLFQSNMVIQRDKPIKIWGWATPGEKVTVSFAGKQSTATAAEDRVWETTLEGMAANRTPQSLTVKGNDQTITLDNILIGDVWILGGQSNMEFPLEKVQNGQLEIVSANYPEIRILTVPAQNGPKEKPGFARLHEWSNWSKRHFRKGDWDVCSPDVARELSAIGYVFARRIHMASQVPIGVIDASRGGTTVETWTPMSVLSQIDTPEVKNHLTEWNQKVEEWDPQQDLDNQIRNHHNWVKNMQKQGRPIPADRKVPDEFRPGPAMDQNRPGNCYASMIAPIAGLSVKGAIFHQGFNNALSVGSAAPKMYHQIFGKMITSWRSAFNDPELPFGIISLCTAGDPQTRDNYLESMFNTGIYIREAQYQTFLDFYQAGDKHIGFASSFDKRRSWYHPQFKLPVGERISRWALATQYGFEKDIKWKPPMYTDMKVEPGQIVLKMDTVVRAVADGPITGFAIAGEDRRFQPADANFLITGKDRNNRPQTDRRTLVLTSQHVPNPIHFRYAWGRNPMANLQAADHNDLPFATQRSDDWPIESVPAINLWDPSTADRQNQNRIKKSLRLEDIGRRLTEAQTFIEQNQANYEKETAAREKELQQRQP